MSKMTPKVKNEFQYDYDHFRYRYISSSGKAGEWEDGTDYVWSKLQLCKELEEEYPMFKGITLFGMMIEVWGKKIEEEKPMLRVDISLNMLQWFSRLYTEMLKRDVPDILKELQQLRERVSKLESDSKKR